MLMITGSEIGKDNATIVDRDDQAGICGTRTPLRILRRQPWSLLLLRSTHRAIRRLSLFGLTTCKFRDGTFETAVPGGNGGRGGVKSRAARATYVMRIRVTPGTHGRMIGHQSFDRVFEFRG